MIGAIFANTANRSIMLLLFYLAARLAATTLNATQAFFGVVYASILIKFN